MKNPNISIFAKPPHFYERGTVVNLHPHLFRTSSLVRGEQVAQRLGCKYNPTEGYENDVRIYVKPTGLEDIRDGAWIDVIDDFKLLRSMVTRPKLGIIFCSQYHYDLLHEKYPNPSVLIPHHHCNFERELRTRKEINTVGYIGSQKGIDIPLEEIVDKLKSLGMTYIASHKFRSREDSVAFYKKIDIQLVWKPDDFAPHTPMKVVNAASYGIPSVAKRCDNYKEIEGFYDAVPNNLDSLFFEIEKLKNPSYYASWSERIAPEMERYHIDNIVPLYEKLNNISS